MHSAHTRTHITYNIAYPLTYPLHERVRVHVSATVAKRPCLPLRGPGPRTAGAGGAVGGALPPRLRLHARAPGRGGRPGGLQRLAAQQGRRVVIRTWSILAAILGKILFVGFDRGRDLKRASYQAHQKEWIAAVKPFEEHRVPVSVGGTLWGSSGDHSEASPSQVHLCSCTLDLRAFFFLFSLPFSGLDSSLSEGLGTR